MKYEQVPLSEIIDRSIDLAQTAFPDWSAKDIRSCHVAMIPTAAAERGVRLITEYDEVANCKTKVPQEIFDQLCGQRLEIGIPIVYNGQNWIVLAAMALEAGSLDPLEVGDMITETTIFDTLALAPAHLVDVTK